MPDIPGVKVNPTTADQFRYDVKNLLGRSKTTFPGAQPVSFASRHLLKLQQEDFYVCEKTDGIRCLMYLTKDDDESEVVYLIDRRNDYWRLSDLHFPQPGAEQAFHIETILDGELVNERQLDGKCKMQYLVFDCLVMDGGNLMHRTLDKRLAYFRDKLFKPYKALYDKYPEELDFVPFTIHFKQVEFAYAIQKMFQQILPSLNHGSDGLIFTCRNSPYTPGTDQNILKWKPQSENSIDFRMRLNIPEVTLSDGESSYLDYSSVPQFQLWVLGDNKNYHWYGNLELTSDQWDQMKAENEPLQDRVVECYRDDHQSWRLLRFRDDKMEANHISTVESVMASIQDGVTEQNLLNYAEKIREQWKLREADGDDPHRSHRSSKAPAGVRH